MHETTTLLLETLPNIQRFKKSLTANLSRNLAVIFLNRLRFDRIVVMSLCGPISLAHPVGLGIAEQRQLQYQQGRQEAQLPQKNA